MTLEKVKYLTITIRGLEMTTCVELKNTLTVHCQHCALRI